MSYDEYLKNITKRNELKKLVEQDPYRLSYHLMAPTGWLNDPNGLCQFKDVHHIYFQYTPFSATWGLKIWGHYTTKDFIHYNEELPFIFPDNQYDKDGVYSGSAFIKDDEIHYFYTGNVKHIDKEYNYISDGREQNTMHIVSKDGYHFDNKKIVFTNDNYPSDCSKHVRDPKIYEKNGNYYMVLGARTLADKGCVLMYKSTDLVDWEYHMRIDSNMNYGYMWECPDLFDCEGETFLLVCPQGMAQDGYKYQNIYQCGYFKLDLDVENKRCTCGPFIELDYGFDIYASQTYQDESGRRILLSWMGIPDSDYDNDCTVEKGWQHALTLPKQLTVEDGKLYQKTLGELKQLRCNSIKTELQNETIEITNASEIFIEGCTDEIAILLNNEIELKYHNQLFTLNLEKVGRGRKQRYVEIPKIKNMHLFMDHSSLEIFINDGEFVLTSRFYGKEKSNILASGYEKMTIYSLNGYEINEFDYNAS